MAGKIWKTTATSPDRRLRRPDRAKLEWTRIAIPTARVSQVEALAAAQGKTVPQVLLEGLELWLEKNQPPALPGPEAPPSARWLPPPRRLRLPFRGTGSQTSS